MAKKKANTPSQNQSVVVQDFGINIQTVDRSRMDLNRWRLALQAAESVLQPTRRLLYNLYADAYLDEHLRSVMDQRRVALTDVKLTFKRNGEVVEDIQRIINSEGFEELVTHLHDSRYYGYSLCYADLTAKNGLGEPEPIVELVPREHVIPSRTLVVVDPNSMEGIDYSQPPYTHLYIAAGKPKDLGLLAVAAVLVLIKRGDVSDWATFNEVFGQPTRVFYYTSNDPAQKNQVESAAKNTGSMSYIVLPDGSKVEFPDVNKTGSADTYQRLMQAMDAGMSKLIVGQTMTTENGSSRSQGEVHERLAEKIARSDQRFILNILNSRVRALMAAQGLPTDGQFEFEETKAKLTETEQLTNAISVHTKVAPIELQWFTDTFGYPFDEAEIERRRQAIPATEPDEDDQQPADKKKTNPKRSKPKTKPSQAGPAGKQKNTIPERRLLELWEEFKGFFAQALIR
ncbi:phage portal protein family protein [Spirosoma aerolatum]|uniref:phage portal protein family protein n=1 Tax=Spirosoma aerolatum TaxID=1211326 RepID=UPI0009AD0C28|nr:DUF935 family protein [Spirosoma aerolatum]